MLSKIYFPIKKTLVPQEPLWDSNAFQNLLPHEEKNLSPAGAPVGLKCLSKLAFLTKSVHKIMFLSCRVASFIVSWGAMSRPRMSRCVFYRISPQNEAKRKQLARVSKDQQKMEEFDEETWCFAFMDE